MDPYIDVRHANGKQAVRRRGRRLLLCACALLCGMLGTGAWVTYQPAVPDFNRYLDVEQKKQAFFEYLMPHVDAANQAVLKDRLIAHELKASLAESPLNWFERFQLQRLTHLYLSSEDAADMEGDHALLNRILLRADAVPDSLVLVQAAKESGWGTSRFAVNGYNFFGHQCFDAGCGFTPRQRKRGRRHEVARFVSPQDSVRAYIHNLNTHARYRKFRSLRQQIRHAGEALSGVRLAEALVAYSERGVDYVSEIQSMIEHNELE